MRLTCLNLLLYACQSVCLCAWVRDRDRCDKQKQQKWIKYTITSKNNVQKINNKLYERNAKWNPIYIVKQSLTRLYSAL